MASKLKTLLESEKTWSMEEKKEVVQIANELKKLTIQSTNNVTHFNQESRRQEALLATIKVFPKGPSLSM